MEGVVCTTCEKFREQNSALNPQLIFCEDTSVLREEKIIGGHVVRNRLVCQAAAGIDLFVRFVPNYECEIAFRCANFDRKMDKP